MTRRDIALSNEAPLCAMTQFNLRLLNAFMEVARLKSFKKAAFRIGRSESAVSAQIKQLEMQIGAQLFIRDTRNVELSNEGKILFAKTEEVFFNLYEAIDEIRTASETHKNQLRIAASPIISANYIPTIIGKFRNSYPDNTVHVFECYVDEMIELIRNNDVDFGIGTAPSQLPDIHSHNIIEEEFVSVFPSSWINGNLHEIDIEEFIKYPLILQYYDGYIYKMLKNFSVNNNVDFDAKYFVRETKTMLELVSKELGVTLLAKSVVPKDNDLLSAVPFKGNHFHRNLSILYLRGTKLSPQAMTLSRIVTKYIRDQLRE